MIIIGVYSFRTCLKGFNTIYEAKWSAANTMQIGPCIYLLCFIILVEEEVNRTGRENKIKPPSGWAGRGCSQKSVAINTKSLFLISFRSTPEVRAHRQSKLIKNHTE